MTISWLGASACAVVCVIAPIAHAQDAGTTCPDEVRGCSLGVRYWSGEPDVGSQAVPTISGTTASNNVIQRFEAYEASRGGLDVGTRSRNLQILAFSLLALALVTAALWWLARSERWHLPGWLELSLLALVGGLIWAIIPPYLVRPPAALGAKDVVSTLRELCADGAAPEGAACSGNGFAERFPARLVEGQPQPQDALSPVEACLDPVQQESVRQSLLPGANPDCARFCAASTGADADAILAAAGRVERLMTLCPAVRDGWRLPEGISSSDWTACESSLAARSYQSTRLSDWGMRMPWAGAVLGLLWAFGLLLATGSASWLRARRYAGAKE